MARDGTCDADCEDQMRHVMTVHVRKFTAASIVANKTIAEFTKKHPQLATFNYDVQPAAYLTMRIAEAFGEFATARGHPYLRQSALVSNA